MNDDTAPAEIKTAAPANGAVLKSAVQALGLQVQSHAHQALLTATFLGEVLLATGRWLRGKSGMRWSDLWRQVDATGPLSLPIVSLVCFLIGLMLAYMGGSMLDKMGGTIYVANIVAVGMVRELAGLMTGLVLAGRVGAAYAAQIATMKAGEEIDALRVLGIDPIDHLVLPRMLALVLVMPLLMAFAALAGILAGLVPATLAYNIPAAEYWNRAVGAITWTHLWIGLFKGVMYAALLSLAGCREGLQAGRDAQAVGQATTAGVVKGLVWIIAAAALSTVMFTVLGY